VIIGDAEQSIFTFAGAHPEHFRAFTLPDTDEYTIADNRRSTDRIIALLNHVRSGQYCPARPSKNCSEPVQLLVGAPAVAFQYARQLLPEGESLLIVARNNSVVQQAQRPTTARTGLRRGTQSIMQTATARYFSTNFSQELFSRANRSSANAVETILRGIGHTKGNLKEPLQSTIPRSTQQRRAIAISLLEALIGLGTSARLDDSLCCIRSLPQNPHK